MRWGEWYVGKGIVPHSHTIIVLLTYKVYEKNSLCESVSEHTSTPQRLAQYTALVFTLYLT